MLTTLETRKAVFHRIASSMTTQAQHESWCESWRFECRHCGKMAFDLADRILDVMTGKTKVSWHTVCGTVREPLVHSGLTPEKLRTVSPVVSPTAAGMRTPIGDVGGRSCFPPTMRSNPLKNI